jgi:hypothetical protein
MGCDATALLPRLSCSRRWQRYRRQLQWLLRIRKMTKGRTSIAHDFGFGHGRHHRRSSLLPGTRDIISVILVNKGLLALLALVLALHVSFGCGVVQAAATMEAPCCGPNCPMASSVGESACCHSQNSCATTEEISRPSIPASRPLVGLISVLIIPPARIAIEQTGLLQGSPPGSAKQALLCTRQI